MKEEHKYIIISCICISMFLLGMWLGYKKKAYIADSLADYIDTPYSTLSDKDLLLKFEVENILDFDARQNPKITRGNENGKPFVAIELTRDKRSVLRAEILKRMQSK